MVFPYSSKVFNLRSVWKEVPSKNGCYKTQARCTQLHNCWRTVETRMARIKVRFERCSEEHQYDDVKKMPMNNVLIFIIACTFCKYWPSFRPHSKTLSPELSGICVSDSFFFMIGWAGLVFMVFMSKNHPVLVHQASIELHIYGKSNGIMTITKNKIGSWVSQFILCFFSTLKFFGLTW